MPLNVPKPDPKFPTRPTPAEIDLEYTPDRVRSLARYVASRTRHVSAEQFEEDESVCVLAIYKRIAQYKAGNARINPNYSFYHWLLFHVKTDFRDSVRRETRALGGRRVERLSDMSDPPVTDLDTDTRLDLETAIAKCTPRQQEVARRYFFEHETQVEIAAELGISQPAVQQLLAKAKKTIGETLNPSEDE